ncbi:hypothetical protein, partial [Porphyromonas gingivalis]|uniref:hypothetical protein n=1 Tax=Porphyromonas gingivalis TaxID=837 RepID=UPI003FA00839
QFTHYRATKNEYEVLNPSHPKETGSNEATTTNHNTILMRHPCSMLRGGNTLKAKALHICGKSYEENRSLTRLGLYGDYVV